MPTSKYIYKKIGMRVREIRKAKGVTQEKLALESGLNRAYVGYIERGERHFSIETVYRISKVLRTPLHKFFFLGGGDKYE